MPCHRPADTFHTAAYHFSSGLDDLPANSDGSFVDPDDTPGKQAPLQRYGLWRWPRREWAELAPD